jgi:hypothetical protein
LKAIRRLFGQFPEVGGPANEGLEQRAERMALRATGFLTALDGFAVDLVEDAVDLVLRGELPGHDGRFAPTPPMLATACRLAAEKNARRNYLNGIKAPRLAAPEIRKTAEQRQRVKELAKHAAETIGAVNLDTSEAEMAASKERWAKVNDYFAPPQDAESLTERLNLRRDRLGYSIGSPESDDAAA